MKEFLEFKAALSSDDAGTITGLAWVFDKADRVGDVIERKSFNLSGKLPLLFGHDQNQPIGVWDSIVETDKGLEVKGRLLINDVQRAKEVHALIKEDALSGLSIGFVTQKSTVRKGGGRTITALDLLEISVVSVPAHPDARIISAKADDAKKETQMEDDVKEREAELAALEVKMDAKFEAKLAKIEAKLNRPAIITEPKASDDLEAKAFMNFARKGVERMDPLEVKELTVAVDASAGFLAPESFQQELIKLLVQFSPIRQYAKVIQVGAAEIKYPRRLTSPSGTWTGEVVARTGSEPSYEQLTMTPHELATFTDVSNALLEDNIYNLQSELASEFAESFGVSEGLAFVSGNGTGKPKGLLATGVITNEIKTGVAADFPASNPADKVIDLFHKLPGVHAQNAVWLMNRNTLGVVRKWKDSTGNYLLISPITAGAPNTILGRPVVEAVDMPDIGAGTNPILFGDMQGYRIIDRVNLSILRDPYTLATVGQVRFHARKRVGGDVTHPDRFARLKCAV
jgi:HK97 family phage major capsid protein/HK97 family phage prohead protease